MRISVLRIFAAYDLRSHPLSAVCIHRIHVGFARCIASDVLSRETGRGLRDGAERRQYSADVHTCGIEKDIHSSRTF